MHYIHISYKLLIRSILYSVSISYFPKGSKLKGEAVCLQLFQKRRQGFPLIMLVSTYQTTRCHNVEGRSMDHNRSEIPRSCREVISIYKQLARSVVCGGRRGKGKYFTTLILTRK
jgi:hypothetical protein